MKIVIFEVEGWEREAFEDLQHNHDLHLTSEKLSADNASDYEDADIISTFIYSDLGRQTLEQFQQLKLIATRSTGYDHVDADTCREQDITICTVPRYGANTVAEHTFGLLLTISHRLNEAIDRTRKGDFSPRGLQGFDLRGRTMGVIGTGDIGLHTIRIAGGFGMEVLAFDIRKNEQAAEDLQFTYVDFDELLSRSDVISLHVPANPQTEHLIGQEQFEKLKEGAVLLNTSRGVVVDERAMLRALAEGKLAGAGLDVLPQEPVIREEAELLRRVYEEQHDLDTLLADHVLIRLQNVVVTPHTAFNTREAVQRILDTTIDNIHGFVSGEPKNAVDLEPEAAAS